MANLWGKLASMARRAGVAGVLRRLPRSIQTVVRAGQKASRGPSRPQLPRSARGYAQIPPGPALEPPVLAEIVQKPVVPTVPAPPKRDIGEAPADFLNRAAAWTQSVNPATLTPGARAHFYRLQEVLRQAQRQQAAEKAEETDEEIAVQTYGRGIIGRGEAAAEQALIGRSIRTPKSSNVYAFVYEAAEEGGGEGTMYSPSEAARRQQLTKRHQAGTWRGPYRGSRFGVRAGGILYVTFKLWHPGQKGERPNEPGPTYAYYDVPMAEFKAFFERAKESPGGAVWDYLRIRGTKHGHMHQYKLVHGAYVPGGGKLVQAGGVYVPRKATAKGYAKRSLPQQGVGRRVATQSQLPATRRR